MITLARNHYVHRGTEVSDDFALASIDLAMYAIFIFARLSDQFPGNAPTCAAILQMLDARSGLTTSADADIQRFASDNQMFHSFFKDLLPSEEEVRQHNEAWSEFVKFNEEWSQRQGQRAR